MANRFIIKNKVYDTSKMERIGKVRKRYKYRSGFFGENYGTMYTCEYTCDVYCSKGGNWLIVHKAGGQIFGEAISELEAKNLLMQYDYDAYVKKYGELEEA